ncbi:MAG: fumarate reductase subunit D [Gemmatimonadetes bacterium]|nr:fumarate reductase subunit D [Gemmatimonadota bacterium]NIQ52915.1 fumarate reductase subunit D [Gemmatimonadota bacterium]NIU73047.1 fumarate reductase subunit D [Gammaproteobacteria bacterium]NIX43383.1 fumarate reductase subunit D [Gemmatimonadota bacterium]NIY07559.1 fumarate reductase subunit D [Gemmatimonadota bacterium]
MTRSREPGVWALFSAGGMIAALVLPAVVLLLWVAPGLGWVDPLSHDAARVLFGHPLTRIVLFGIVVLSLFHAAHRLRYTLYDGLQLYHLNPLIAALTYGLATALSLLAAVVFGLWL